jgi:uncharacterized protein (TIGR03663 family)
METETKKASWLEKPIRNYIPELNIEVLIIILIIILALVSRFAILGNRVMSHDEINHVIPSYDLSEGRGYVHDPVTHGPFQFHLVALSYFIFGDSDFSSRVPAAVFSIATVIFVLFAFRRYLGRVGALLASIMFLISPYILYYGRYTRNEAFLELISVIAIYAILKYLDEGKPSSILLLTIATALHFTIKETSYIFVAETLIFVFVLFIEQVLRTTWKDPYQKRMFLYLVVFVMIMFVMVFGISFYQTHNSPIIDATAEAVTETTDAIVPTSSSLPNWTAIDYVRIVGIVLVMVGIAFSIWFLFMEFGWKQLKELRAFNLLIMQGTLVLPLLVAFPINLFGRNPMDYSSSGLIYTGTTLVISIIAAGLIGMLWDSKKWFLNAAVFWTIFVLFYTTFFTNPNGFFTGVVGSLGYWLSQQGVQRGGQPLYYYALVQIPVYEFLPAIGVVMALIIGIRKNLFASVPGISPVDQNSIMVSEETEKIPTLSLLLYWTLISLVAYSFAGERMPWITVHIAIPMILTAGWAFGYFVEKIDWKGIKEKPGWQMILLLGTALYGFVSLVNSLIQPVLPFAGKNLDNLNVTSYFLFSIFLLVTSISGIVYLKSKYAKLAVGNSLLLIILLLATAQTVRASYMANYINYDNAKEYLVYAHAASGPKEAFAQIEEISRRITGGKDIDIAYDNDINYPYWWYLRDYPNKLYYADQPSREVGQKSLIAAGDSTMNKLEPIVKENYIEYSYMRLWWPNQDYMDLNWDKIKDIFTNRDKLRGILKIWLNRDYTDYAEATGSGTFTLENWEPSSKMKFFIRKDIAAQIWDYGVVPENIAEEIVDPYTNYYVNFPAISAFGTTGSNPGSFQAPRGIAVAADNTIYIADSQNHRIQHLTPDGEVIETWGSYSGETDVAPNGLFNEPWGIAVGPDGSVYVSDTWNHRIQKFDAHGKFITTWGYFGQAETPDAFWGPRQVTVDSKGYVYVADTGNKRIVIFTGDGEYVNQFGTYGFNPGEFDEPVGVAVDANGEVFITDTWNQRVQVFASTGVNEPYLMIRYWDVAAWYGQSLENKPFIAISDVGDVYITDPEGPRVLQFTNSGDIIRVWGDYSADLDGFGLASGVAMDQNGNILVTDGSKNRVLRFDLATLLSQ